MPKQIGCPTHGIKYRTRNQLCGHAQCVRGREKQRRFESGEIGYGHQMKEWRELVPAWKPPHAVAGVTLARLMARR